MNFVRTVMLAGLAGACVGLTAGAYGAGADIKYSGLGGSILKFGPVNNTYAYILGSNTCNVGDASLSWINMGTPALMMNAYRLSDHRLVQIGTGNAKTACCVGNSTSPLCAPACSSVGFGLRPGCMDTYSASFNASQPKLAPRRYMNPQTGVVATNFPATSGTAIFRRLQVLETDMNATAWPGALFFVEGQYICTEDRVAGNDLNNASYQRVALDALYNMTAQGGLATSVPAIYAWHDHGLGAGVPDNDVIVQTVDVPDELGQARFIVASRITPNGKTWHYEYAIQNFNSSRAASSFAVPIPAGAIVTNVGFHDVWYHDDDAIYDGTDWVSPASSFEVRWSCPQTYAQNVNANALRYGSLYNFWFDCDHAPQTAKGEVGIFKTAVGCQPSTVRFGLSVPGPDCAADIARNGRVDVDDVLAVITGWGPCGCQYNCAANITGAASQVDINDLTTVIANWGGCP